MTRSPTRPLLLLLLAMSLGCRAAHAQQPPSTGAAPAKAAGERTTPDLVLEAAEVTPRTAAADVLCQLRARIRNAGTQVASGFVFAVELDGHEVAVYRNHVFMDPIEPGETRSLRLYGFWTNETGRALPASGGLSVELSLVEARWMKAEKDAEGTLVWRDLGAVEGLPQVARQTVEITR